MKKIGGGGGRNRVKFRFEVSVPKILGFFMFLGGYGGQNVKFFAIYRTKLLILMLRIQIYHH